MHRLLLVCSVALLPSMSALAQSNIDDAHRVGWGENVGWINVGNGAGPIVSTADVGTNNSPTANYDY